MLFLQQAIFSISADIVRIKLFRNEVFSHTTSIQCDNATFEKLWQEISQPLVRLGIAQHEIDELKVAPLSLEEKRYIEQLKEWKEPEETIKNFKSSMVDKSAEVRKLKGTLCNILWYCFETLRSFSYIFLFNM